MELVVRFRAAVALLGRFPALAGIDLDIPPGQIVLLRGPNGAGKTTFLRACAGLVPVVAGEAAVLGSDLRSPAGARRVRRRVGLLGHSTALYDDLTVDENVRFWGRATRSDPADVEAALHLLGLDGRLRGVAASRLSAGQRRRTSLACLLARRPELWLLDEPHAGMDNDARDQVDDLVRQAVRQGATVLLSSHELDRARELADRVVEIDGGMVQDDTWIWPDADARSGATRADTAPGPGSGADTTRTSGSAQEVPASGPAGGEVAGVA
jgi:ABC-2 type transport system ATP-binding protein